MQYPTKSSPTVGLRRLAGAGTGFISSPTEAISPPISSYSYFFDRSDTQVKSSLGMQAYSSNSSGSNSNSGGAKASYSPFFTPAKFLEQTLADSSSSLSATTSSTAAAARRPDKEEEEDSNRFVWQAILFNSDLAKVADDSMSGQNHRYEPYEVPSHQQPPQNQIQQSGSRQPSYIHYHPNGVVAPSGSAPGSLASSASGSLGGASTSSKATPSTPLDALQQLRQRSSATYEGKPACDHCRRR